MIRFVDVRWQGVGERFAFWDTVDSTWRDYDNDQAWVNWRDLEESVRREADSSGALPGDLEQHLARLRGLCPPWVFELYQPKEIGDESDECFGEARTDHGSER